MFPLTPGGGGLDSCSLGVGGVGDAVLGKLMDEWSSQAASRSELMTSQKYINT